LLRGHVAARAGLFNSVARVAAFRRGFLLVARRFLAALLAFYIILYSPIRDIKTRDIFYSQRLGSIPRLLFTNDIERH
jgi:hypothetical protein